MCVFLSRTLRRWSGLELRKAAAQKSVFPPEPLALSRRLMQKRSMEDTASNSRRGRGRGGGRGGYGGGGRDERAPPSDKPAVPDTPIVAAFRQFSIELDDINDRRERLVKLSRDTTIGSKRLIFLLHRYMDNPQSIREQADADLVKIRENLDRIAGEIDGHEYFRYLRSFSPGLQEYMEAVSFYYFLKHRDLITKKQIEDDIQEASPTKRRLMITDMEYLLGVSDLTGELMRLCINSVATRNAQLSHDILKFLRKMHDGFAALPAAAFHGELGKKMQVTKESLQKVETVCFNVKVRGSEYPEEMLAQMELSGFQGDDE